MNAKDKMRQFLGGISMKHSFSGKVKPNAPSPE